MNSYIFVIKSAVSVDIILIIILKEFSLLLVQKSLNYVIYLNGLKFQKCEKEF